MTVAELIEALKAYPPEYTVMALDIADRNHYFNIEVHGPGEVQYGNGKAFKIVALLLL